MSRPSCDRHPDSDVRRNGYYGKNNEYIQWQCIPGNGDDIHYISREMSPKLVGGLEGHCRECGRKWHATDGMDAAERDRFTLREKAYGLVELSKGHSYRQASNSVRKRAGYIEEHGETTYDGRLCRDWVSQYAPILADHYLPTEWPEVLLLDNLPFHVSAQSGVKSGRHAFSVFGALSYGDGSLEEVLTKKDKPRPRLWALHPSEGQSADDWKAFLAKLDGQPIHVVCDRDPVILKAIEWLWPHARVYASTSHLALRVRELLQKYHLRDTTNLSRHVSRRTFSGSGTDAYRRYLQFWVALRELLQKDRSEFNDKQVKGLGKLKRWFEKHQREIVKSLVEWHWPVSIGALERALKVVKEALYDRRHNFKNMERLQHLLYLLQLSELNLDDERAWEEVLRRNHEHHHWQPPPRRLVDDPELITRK